MAMDCMPSEGYRPMRPWGAMGLRALRTRQPSFLRPLRPSHLQFPQTKGVEWPGGFVEKHFDNSTSGQVTFESAYGVKHVVQWILRDKLPARAYFTVGWEGFAKSSAYQVGDVLLFTLVAPQTFSVSTIRAASASQLAAGDRATKGEDERERRQATSSRREALKIPKMEPLEENCSLGYQMEQSYQAGALKIPKMAPLGEIVPFGHHGESLHQVGNLKTPKLEQLAEMPANTELSMVVFEAPNLRPRTKNRQNVSNQQELVVKKSSELKRKRTNEVSAAKTVRKSVYRMRKEPTSRGNGEVWRDPEAVIALSRRSLEGRPSLPGKVYQTTEWVSQRRPVSEEEKERAWGEAADFLRREKGRLPAFMKRLLPSHVYRGFWFGGVPARFWREYLPGEDGPIRLRDAGGAEWAAAWKGGGRGGVSGGWQAFARAHGLEEHDVCVFQLLSKKKSPDPLLLVNIFRVVEPPNGRDSWPVKKSKPKITADNNSSVPLLEPAEHFKSPKLKSSGGKGRGRGRGRGRPT